MKLALLAPINEPLWLSRVTAHPDTDDLDVAVAENLLSRTVVYQALADDQDAFERSVGKLIDLRFLETFSSSDTAAGESFELVFRLPEGLDAGRS